jgi:hypothetical protein
MAEVVWARPRGFSDYEVSDRGGKVRVRNAKSMGERAGKELHTQKDTSGRKYIVVVGDDGRRTNSRRPTPPGRSTGPRASAATT